MARWPDLHALELLIAVADHGSLSAAARSLGLAQPNASRSVARLERSFGLPMLHRSTAGSSLTPEGLLVVAWARQVLTAASDLMRNATTLSREDAGALTVTASQTIAEQLLPGWLTVLQTSHPAVRVTVRVANTAAVLVELHAGECDLGFIEGPIPRGSAQVATVGEDRLVLVAAPGHPWARKRRPILREDLLDHALITREPGSGTRRVLDEALGTPAVPQLELASNAAVRVAVLSGAGPAVLSRLVVGDAIAAGTLVELHVEGLELRRQLRAAWTGPRQPTGPAATLLKIAIASRSRVRDLR